MSNIAPRNPSNMNHAFSRVPTVSIARSQFDRSHTIKTAFDADYLIPFLVDEVLPGDSLSARLSAFVRLATPIKPIMDNLYLDTFYFFVPNRLLQTNWQKLQGAQDNPGDSISFIAPTIPFPAGGPEVGSLADYFGIPTDMTNAFSVASYHFRAYNLIYNTWFRDQNLQNSLVVDVDDGPDTLADYVLRKRGKRHDYFTSALPWPQKGTAVSLPVGSSSAPVIGDGKTLGFTDGSGNFAGSNMSAAAYMELAANAYNVALPGNHATTLMASKDVGITTVSGESGMIADLSTAFATTVNDLRTAIATQELLEQCARSGTRYPELIKSIFGVTVPDYTVQRPEYLGGGSTPINIHPVPQTSPTSGANAQGQLAAFGTAALNNHGFKKSFVEHGVIIGLANVRADLTYSQGLHRMWSRSTRYDFMLPQFAHLGEQAILNKEIYNDLADGTGAAQRSGVFGYQERYADYRYKPSMITSVLRPAYATPLDTWHLSEEFGSQPSLNAAFIESATPVDRVIAVPSEPHFIFDGYMNYIHARPMPVFGIPGMGARI